MGDTFCFYYVFHNDIDEVDVESISIGGSQERYNCWIRWTCCTTHELTVWGWNCITWCFLIFREFFIKRSVRKCDIYRLHLFLSIHHIDHKDRQSHRINFKFLCNDRVIRIYFLQFWSNFTENSFTYLIDINYRRINSIETNINLSTVWLDIREWYILSWNTIDW